MGLGKSSSLHVHICLTNKMFVSYDLLQARYILDDESRLRTFLEEHESKANVEFSLKELSWLPDIVKDFVLPAGFPGSVSDDYLEYMLLQFPTNVTAWICHTLVTSSLLKARQSNSGRLF